MARTAAAASVRVMRGGRRTPRRIVGRTGGFSQMMAFALTRFTGITHASAEVRPGNLYAALPGRDNDAAVAHTTPGVRPACSSRSIREFPRALSGPVELTAAGRLILATATDVVDRAEERMLAGIAAQDRDRLAMLLQYCVDNLQTPAATGTADAVPPRPAGD